MQPLVELERVRFSYGLQPVLDDVSLHIHPGQFVGLVGPSGAGKSTLLKLILGTLRPHAGIVRRGSTSIAYVPQLETIDWSFPITVEQAVLLGRVRQRGLWPWPSAAERRRVHDVLEQLEIAAFAKQPIRKLSGGQQQRVFLARALVADPELLVLDEPTTGVDLHTAENILHLLAELVGAGMTIIMTTHDLNSAAAHIPWVVCLNRRIIGQGAPEHVFTEQLLNEAYGGSMLVLQHDGMLVIQQRPHGHTYRDIVPEPVPGHVPAEQKGAQA